MRHSTADMPQDGFSIRRLSNYSGEIVAHVALLRLPLSPDARFIAHDDLIANFFVYLPSLFVSLHEKQRFPPRLSFIRTRVCADAESPVLLMFMSRLQEGKKFIFWIFFSLFFLSLYDAFSIFTVVFFCCTWASHKMRITEWKINARAKAIALFCFNAWILQ